MLFCCSLQSWSTRRCWIFNWSVANFHLGITGLFLKCSFDVVFSYSFITLGLYSMLFSYPQLKVLGKRALILESCLPLGLLCHCMFRPCFVVGDNQKKTDSESWGFLLINPNWRHLASTFLNASCYSDQNAMKWWYLLREVGSQMKF